MQQNALTADLLPSTLVSGLWDKLHATLIWDDYGGTRHSVDIDLFQTRPASAATPSLHLERLLAYTRTAPPAPISEAAAWASVRSYKQLGHVDEMTAIIDLLTVQNRRLIALEKDLAEARRRIRLLEINEGWPNE